VRRANCYGVVALRARGGAVRIASSRARGLPWRSIRRGLLRVRRQHLTGLALSLEVHIRALFLQGPFQFTDPTTRCCVTPSLLPWFRIAFRTLPSIQNLVWHSEPCLAFRTLQGATRPSDEAPSSSCSWHCRPNGSANASQSQSTSCRVACARRSRSRPPLPSTFPSSLWRSGGSATARGT
jgi:hypothetical protein